jgi:hypothetical protein
MTVGSDKIRKYSEKESGVMKKIGRASLLLIVLVFLVGTCSQAFGAALLTPGVNLTPLTPIDTTITPTLPETPTVPGVIQPVQPGPVQVNPGITNLRPWPVIIYPEKDITLKHKQPFLLEFTITKQAELYRVYMDLDGDGYIEYHNPVDVVETKYDGSKFHVSILYAGGYNYKSYDKATVRAYAMWDWDNINDSTDTISQPFKTSGSWDDRVNAAAGNNSVTLSWDPVAARPGRVLYTIERRLFETGDWKPLTDFAIAETTYTDNTAVNLVAYEYRVSVKIGQSVRQIYKTTVAQPKGGTLVMTIGSTTIKLNGVEKQIDTPPVIVSGRTFVPIRALVENIGGTIGYNEDTQEITIQYLGKTVVMQIGNTNATVNGSPATMDVPPYISNEGRTMIPLRFVVENLGLYVQWDDASQSITIHF